MPYRLKGSGPGGSVEVLLITSRDTGRWIIPKGNIDFQQAPHEAAGQEAFEEAGALGEIDPRPLGVFRYPKRKPGGREIVAQVTVFALEVERLLDQWPEGSQRSRRWFSLPDAAQAVIEPELQEIIGEFQPWGQ